MSAPEPVVVGPPAPPAEWLPVVEAPVAPAGWPAPPRPGDGDVAWWLVAALGAWVVDLTGRWLVASLDSRAGGWLPAVSDALFVVARTTAVVLSLMTVAALLPSWLDNVWPVMAVALAVAVGWSARDTLPDLLAWLFLAAEGRVRSGVWLRTDQFGGRVTAVRLRTTWLVDHRGRRVSVPNRELLRSVVTTEQCAHPEVCVVLTLAPKDPVTLRRAVEDAVACSPWTVPGLRAEIGWDPRDPARWSVRIRLLDGAFEDRFAGTLPERVQERLAIDEASP